MAKEEIFNKCKCNKNYYKESVFRKMFPKEYEFVISEYPNILKFQQKLYHWFNDIEEIPMCKTCGNPVEFISPTVGYRKHCSISCSRKDVDVIQKQKKTCYLKYNDENYNNREQSSITWKKTYTEHKDEIIAKTKKTKLERHGDENYRNDEQIKKTCMERYHVSHYSKTNEFKVKIRNTKQKNHGDPTYTNREKFKQTMLERHGVECPFDIDGMRDKIKAYFIETYGEDNPFKIEIFKEKIKQTNLKKHGCENVFGSDEIKEKIKNTNIKRHGVPNPMKSDKIKEKARKTNNKKHNVDWCCMRKEARQHSNDSKPNKIFAQLLTNNNIKFDREFSISHYSYDFIVNDILIEINPTITHNAHINIFNRKPLDANYHLNKTVVANKNGYQCLHVWDWDELNKVINFLFDYGVYNHFNADIVYCDRSKPIMFDYLINGFVTVP